MEDLRHSIYRSFVRPGVCCWAGQPLGMCDLSLWYFVSSPLADLRVWQEESYQLCLALCPNI